MPFVEELWNNTISPYKNWHKQIKWFSIFIKSKQMSEKIENRNKRRRGLPGASPVQPSRSRPAQPGGGPAHQAPPPLSSSLPTGERSVAGARAPPRHASSLPVCLSSPHRSGWIARRHAAAPVPFPLPLAHLLLWLPLTPTERGRRRRREPPWPQPPPRPSVVPTSSATSSSTPSPNHAPPEALQRRLRALLQPSAAGDLVFDSRRLGRPQAH